jgi:SsrA-binding protein
MAKLTAKAGGMKVITVNRKARFNYEILEKFEAGMVLTGAEIKSIRNDGMSINEGYVRPEGGEVWLLNAHIQPYAFSTAQDYNPIRARKLLLNGHEIEKIRTRVEEKGLTVVPLQVYLKDGYAKIEIALARGKSAPDKRDKIKEREGNRDAERAMKRR